MEPKQAPTLRITVAQARVNSEATVNHPNWENENASAFANPAGMTRPPETQGELSRHVKDPNLPPSSQKNTTKEADTQNPSLGTHLQEQNSPPANRVSDDRTVNSGPSFPIEQVFAMQQQHMSDLK